MSFGSKELMGITLYDNQEALHFLTQRDSIHLRLD